MTRLKGLKYSLTSFKEAQEILETLSDNGIDNIVTRYLGAANGGMSSEVSNKVSIMRQLGGKRGLETLKEYTD